MLNLVRLWILLSTLLVSAGWILSALHQLNRAGYATIFAIAGIGFYFWRRKIIGIRKKIRRNFSKNSAAGSNGPRLSFFFCWRCWRFCPARCCPT